MIELIEIVTFDESIIAYQPSSEVKARANQIEPIPVVYIPRKPHPNGLLLYQGATYIQHPLNPTKKLPYLVETLPHLQVGDIAPIENVKKMKER